MVLAPVRVRRGALTIRVQVHPGGARGHLYKHPSPARRQAEKPRSSGSAWRPAAIPPAWLPTISADIAREPSCEELQSSANPDRPETCPGLTLREVLPTSARRQALPRMVIRCRISGQAPGPAHGWTTRCLCATACGAVAGRMGCERSCRARPGGHHRVCAR